MCSGNSCYLMKKYTWKDFLKYNKEHRITVFFTVPAIWAMMAKSPEVTDQFENVEGGLGGAAPMDADLLTLLERGYRLGERME